MNTELSLVLKLKAARDHYHLKIQLVSRNVPLPLRVTSLPASLAPLEILALFLSLMRLSENSATFRILFSLI